jgi:hypothetical protein
MAREIVTSENKAEYDAKKMAQKSYDPGVVNVPLSKRGNIDSDLEKHSKKVVAEKELKSKNFRKEAKEEKLRAKELWEKHKEHILKTTGPKFGEAKIKNTLNEMIQQDPQKFMKFFEKYNAEHKVQND